MLIRRLAGSSLVIRSSVTLFSAQADSTLGKLLISKHLATPSRLFSGQTVSQQQQKADKQTTSTSIIESSTSSSGSGGGSQVSTQLRGAAKAKQVASDAWYSAIIVTGGLVIVAIFYYLFTELFSRETPSGIYDESSKMCLDHFEVREALGTPIKVTAESGGRRVFQIKHKFFVDDGKLFLIINYYLEGPGNRGTVYCKVKKNESTKKFEYESIIVKLDYPYRGQRKINVLDSSSSIY